MPSFLPYTIIHLPLARLEEELGIPPGNCYLVIWSGELPLCNIWYKSTDAGPKRQDMRKQINQAIRPVLSHYFFGSNDRINWEQLLDQGEYRLLSDRLRTVNKKPGSINERKSQGISVIICTRNRPSAIQHCLVSLMKLVDDKVEVIVIDNAPDDNRTELIVAGFKGVRYILETRKGLDIARNTGARYATHDIIAYTDDDVIIPANWIRNLNECFDDPLTMAVTGLVIPAELKTKAQVVFERDWGFNKGYLPKKFDHRYFLDNIKSGAPVWDIGAGANMAFRKEAFLLAGFFDERLDVGASGCSGDSEIWYRVLAEGWNCRYFPHLYVYHQHRRTMAELQNQLFNYMRGHVSSLLVQHENYGHKGNLRRIFKSFPIHYYYRIKGWLTGNSGRDNSTLLKEIKGCIAGWRYYQLNKDRKRRDIYCLPSQVLEEVVITPLTKVSVIIPCYNQGHYLKQAIDSALQQSHSNTEVIVVDDGSADQTAAVSHSYADRVKYIRVERVGLSAARNIGQQLSTGDFVVFLDADDFLYEHALEINLSYFEFFKNIAFVSGGHVRVDDQGNHLTTVADSARAENNYRSLLQGNYIGMEGSVMYRRAVFSHFHFDTSLPLCEDYDLNLRIARILPVFSHDKAIAAYRAHAGNMSRDTKAMLNSALTVLKRQEKGLVNDEEKAAWLLGIENWKKYYAS